MNTTVTSLPRRVTIVDVARHAGVSVASASKVLRDAYGVSDEMKERVRASMAMLNYRPNAAARGLRGKTFTLGVSVPDIDNEFVSALVQGILSVTEPTEYEVLIGPAGNASSSQAKVIDAMVDRQMDGLILFAPYGSADRIAEIAGSTPTVVVSRHGASRVYDTVVGDDMLGARLAVQHLIDHGHERIAYVSHSDGDQTDPHSPQRVRERGYREAMSLLGLEAHIDVVPSTWSRTGGAQAARSLLARSELPSAVFAGADVAAFGMMNIFGEHGTRLPADVSLVGYDNTSVAQLRPVSLTSVDQDAASLGEHAAQLLLERIDGRTEARHVVITPRLEVRATTGAPRHLDGTSD